MELFLLRHGKAADHGSEYPDDSLRPLTSAGKEKMVEIARGMRKMGLEFDQILSSPYVRARETAEIVTKTFQIPEKMKLTDNLIIGKSPKKIIKELESYKDNSRILLVGHEPFLSDLISKLLIGSFEVVAVMKKGGLCKLTVGSLEQEYAELNWLLTPKQMVLMA